MMDYLTMDNFLLVAVIVLFILLLATRSRLEDAEARIRGLRDDLNNPYEVVRKGLFEPRSEKRWMTGSYVVPPLFNRVKAEVSVLAESLGYEYKEPETTTTPAKYVKRKKK